MINKYMYIPLLGTGVGVGATNNYTYIIIMFHGTITIADY